MAANTGDMGNTGNTGDMGITGNSGSAGIAGELGGGWFIEDRVDLPFVMELDAANAPLRFKRLSRSSFGERAWAARWWASLVLHDFVAMNWHSTTDPIMNTEWGLITAATTAAEITALTLAARDERAPAMGEILSQDVEFTTDFMALLAITPGSHPNTYRVLHIASLIGSYTVLYYKGLRNRPRPSQLCPALLPPIPMPGHASWPSGHATQAWLKALCMEHVLQGVLSGSLISGDLGAVSSNLRTLAIRVARNREIAGLHYPTDSDAGRSLAATIAPFLTGMVATTWFGKAVAAAKGEWS
jgi:membrane-associated phospholipid phosphatase